MVVLDDRTPSRPDQGGALALVKGGENGFAYELAPAPLPGDGIDIGDEVVVHVYVYSHVPNLAPWACESTARWGLKRTSPYGVAGRNWSTRRPKAMTTG